MYDHNQTLVPDSFLALHSARGRPLLPRDRMEQRYELCEDLALHTAAFLAAQQQDPDASDDALRRCFDGLCVELQCWTACVQMRFLPKCCSCVLATP